MTQQLTLSNARSRVWLARTIAVLADAVQIAFVPMFVAGGVSPMNDVLDVVVALTLTSLVGWSWAFLPTFATEMIPGFDLAPTWTLAVLYATRKSRIEGETAAPPQPPSDHKGKTIEGTAVLK
jgi:hypothetical protein